jgi:hypothetical protein
MIVEESLQHRNIEGWCAVEKVIPGDETGAAHARDNPTREQRR